MFNTQRLPKDYRKHQSQLQSWSPGIKSLEARSKLRTKRFVLNERVYTVEQQNTTGTQDADKPQDTTEPQNTV